MAAGNGPTVTSSPHSQLATTSLAFAVCLVLVDATWRTDPGRRDIALIRAEALLALGRPRAAAEVLSRLLALAPGDAAASALLAEIGP